MKLTLPLMAPWKDVLVHAALLAAVLAVFCLVNARENNPDTAAALAKAHPGQFPVVVSARYATGPDRSTGRVSYVLLPSFFVSSRLIVAERRNAEPVRLSETGTAPFPLILLLVLAPAALNFRRRWARLKAGA